jgi:hypothetical protein
MRSKGAWSAASAPSAKSAIGACCPSVASLAWSLAVAGMPGSAGGVFRVLADIGGIGDECFSWMGGGSSAVTGLLLI